MTRSIHINPTLVGTYHFLFGLIFVSSVFWLEAERVCRDKQQNLSWYAPSSLNRPSVSWTYHISPPTWPLNVLLLTFRMATLTPRQERTSWYLSRLDTSCVIVYKFRQNFLNLVCGKILCVRLCVCFKFGWQKTRIWIMSIIRCLLTMNRENHFEWWKMGPTEIRWIKCLFWAVALSRVCTTVSLVSSRQLPTRTKGLAGQTAVIMILVFSKLHL